MKHHDITGVLVRPETTILATIEAIDRASLAVALIVDDSGRLLGTVVDGDVRRALMDHVDLQQSVQVILDRKANTRWARPVVAAEGTDAATMLQMFHDHSVNHLPLVDADGRVVDLVLLNDLVSDGDLPLRALIMAGGYGIRLQPLTDNTPKPMLDVDGKPILQRIVEQLSQSGVKRLHISTHYRGEQIIGHLGDGGDYGVRIDYVSESQPLGTAGALGLLGDVTEPLLVVNGDVLTRLDFKKMYEFHRECDAVVTVGIRKEQFQIPFGVVDVDGHSLIRIVEKPITTFFINAGVYLLSPAAIGCVTPGEKIDMPALIQRIIDAGHRVVTFPIREYWIDVGRMEDYERAGMAAKEGLI